MEQYLPVLPFLSYLYDRNGNTDKYCSISGKNISTTGMVILVSIAPLADRTSVVLLFFPLMEQYLPVLPFLSYRCSVH
jgi:hypothetical protein